MRGIVVLLAVSAVLNAAAFEEKSSSDEVAPSNLGEATSPEFAIVDASATAQEDFVELENLADVEGRPMRRIWVKYLKTLTFLWLL